jgi:hypothetical protein
LGFAQDGLRYVKKRPAVAGPASIKLIERASRIQLALEKLAGDAVRMVPVSAWIFPANRDFCRKFFKIGAFTAPKGATFALRPPNWIVFG